MTKPLNSFMVSVQPTTQGKPNVQAKGTVVVCKGGAWPGARIHFQPPSLDNSADEGEPLVNGEAYFAPEGTFREFWIEYPTLTIAQLAVAERTKLLVLDCAQPVVLLNDMRGAGYHYHTLGGATLPEVTFAGGAVTLYDDGAPTTAELTDSTSSLWTPRGWIGGGVRATNPQAYRVTFYEYLDASGTLAELSRLFVNAADGLGFYSCSFAFGMQNTFSGGGSIIRNGALFMPYPPKGLRVDILPTAADLGPTTWYLYERDHAV